jgi:hypothetical protein
MAKTKFLEDGEEAAPSKGKRRAGGVKSVLTKPAWHGKAIALRGQKLEEQVVTQVFTKALKGYPSILKLRLANLILAGGEDNPIRKRHLEDFEEMKEKLEKVVKNKDKEPAANTCVLAAYLGATELPEESTWLADGTFVEDLPEGLHIAATSRAPVELAALGVSRAFSDCNGVVSCYCGQPAAYKQQQGWGNSGKTFFFTCRDGRCRMYITPSALNSLTTLMSDIGVTTIPQFFCPAHPDREIRITEVPDKDGSGPIILQARCPWFSNENNRKEFCCNQRLGEHGDPHAVTGQQVWTALDILATAKK